MKLHPLLDDPRTVLICQTPVSEPVRWEAYRDAARQAMAAMQIDLHGEKAVIKPNVTIGERYADPDTGIGTHPGFTRGRNFPLGLVIAGVNMVAVDSVTSYLMGFDPAQLIYLRRAAETVWARMTWRSFASTPPYGGRVPSCPVPMWTRCAPARRCA